MPRILHKEKSFTSSAAVTVVIMTFDTDIKADAQLVKLTLLLKSVYKIVTTFIGLPGIYCLLTQLN